MTSDIHSVYERSRRLLMEIQQFLDSVEPVIGRRPLPPGRWYADLQDACNRAHYLWSVLDELQRHLDEERTPPTSG